MSNYWCPVRYGTIRPNGGLFDALQNDRTMRGLAQFRPEQIQDNHLVQQLARDYCNTFIVQAGEIQVTAEGWPNADRPVDLARTMAICEEHRVPATVIDSVQCEWTRLFHRLEGRWYCSACAQSFNTDTEFVTHLNERRGDMRYYQQLAQGIPTGFPPGINWRPAEEFFQQPDAFDPDEDEPWDDDDDRDEIQFEPDPEPIDLGRVTFEWTPQQEVTIVNHFRDDVRPPVTTGDGRYLRWNELSQQYEEARRPATNLHDIFGG